MSRVFVSSTWEDLKPERDAVEQAVHRMHDAEFQGMEYFGSRPETPHAASLREVDRADVYVGIIGERYGSGITEAEYRRARERGIPCIVYLSRRDPQAPVPNPASPLERLRQELGSNHIVGFFSNPAELATLVVADLHNQLAQLAPPKPAPDAARRGNLPAAVDGFVGRADDLTRVATLLTANRMVTLVGPGGIGKTRLALEVAELAVEDYPNGAWLVPLAAVVEAALVPQSLATVLGVREQAGQPLLDTIAASLRDQRALIVLDNCEHLRQACAALAARLLRDCPGVRVLATSRARIGAPGETTWRVRALVVPAAGERNPAVLMGIESIELFVERARRRDPSFEMDPEALPALAAICTRLEGIPLAIELAAARTAALTIQQIETRLHNRFRLLAGGDADSPRHQTLRATIDWSHDLLAASAQPLFRRLAVFRDGWTLEAAEEICVGGLVGVDDVLDLHGQLVEESLVLMEQRDGTARYRLLETVREYATEKLEAAGEADEVHERHLAWYSALAEKAEPALAGPQQAAWVSRLDDEHANLRDALVWAVRSRQIATGLRLGASLCRFWVRRGHFAEGRERLTELLAVPSDDAPAARARVITGLGSLAYYHGDYEEARGRHEEARGLYESVADRHGTALALSDLGRVARLQGDLRAARDFQERALAIHREVDDRGNVAQSLLGLGLIAFHSGDYPGARERYIESLARYREIGHLQGVAAAQGNAARVASLLGDYEEARARLEECLATFERLGDRYNVAVALETLGYVALELGDNPAARGFFERGAHVRRQIGGRQGLAELLEGFACILAQEEQPETAFRLVGAAAALRDAIRCPIGAVELERLALFLSGARGQLGAAGVAAATEAGRGLSADSALAAALIARPPAVSLAR